MASSSPQVIAGPSGTGKSHFTGVWHRPRSRRTCEWPGSLETLSAAIGKSKVDGSTARTVARICWADLIVVDDIGLLPVGEDAAEAFYRITAPLTNAARSQ
ncbi:ATP-binding protein [Streptomyces sp. NPDC055287]